MKIPELNRESLIKFYKEEKLSLKEIAKLYSTSISLVARRMKKYNIKTRNLKEAIPKFINKNQRNKIIDLYKNNKTIKYIMNITNLSRAMVKKVLIEENLISPHRIIKTLTDLQKQVILGSLLGDGCITKKGRTYAEGHCEKHKEYTEYKAKIFNSKVHKVIRNKNKIKGSPFYQFSYGNKKELQPIYNMCYPNGKKTISENWANQINSLGIALWFMDDGNSCKGKKSVNVRFATHCFKKQDCEILQKMLLNFNIQSNIIKSNGGLVINILQISVNDFMNLIESHVKKIPCMMYKIQKRDFPVTKAVKYPFIDYYTLQDLYINQKLSMEKIAIKFNTYSKLIQRLLIKYKIPARKTFK